MIETSRAAGLFLEKNPGAEKFRVTLYGSLALTGKGHGTDSAILKVIDRPDAVEIVWKPDISLPRHPNGMLFEAFVQGNTVDSWVEAHCGTSWVLSTTEISTRRQVWPR